MSDTLQTKATVFGLNLDGSPDSLDNGLGFMGANTRDPGLKGVSLPIEAFNQLYGGVTKGKNIIRQQGSPMVRVLNPATGKEGTYPLVDLGPSVGQQQRGVGLDLTLGAARELGATGLDPMQYSIASAPGATGRLTPGQFGTSAPQVVGAPQDVLSASVPVSPDNPLNPVTVGQMPVSNQVFDYGSGINLQTPQADAGVATGFSNPSRANMMAGGAPPAGRGQTAVGSEGGDGQGFLSGGGMLPSLPSGGPNAGTAIAQAIPAIAQMLGIGGGQEEGGQSKPGGIGSIIGGIIGGEDGPDQSFGYRAGGSIRNLFEGDIGSGEINPRLGGADTAQNMSFFGGGPDRFYQTGQTLGSSGGQDNTTGSPVLSSAAGGSIEAADTNLASSSANGTNKGGMSFLTSFFANNNSSNSTGPTGSNYDYSRG